MTFRLPGQYSNQLDNQLGVVAPSGDGARVVVGPSSLGAVNQLVALSDATQIRALIGDGPGPRAVADQLSQGGGVVFFVRSAAGLPGVVTPNGTNPVSPAVTLTGAALDRYDLVVTITTAGAVGTSAFTYSLDGGDTVLGPIATAAAFAIPGTGLTLNFAAGAYALNAVYQYAITAPRSTVAEAQTAIRAALAASNVLYEYIQLAQPSDSAMWAALAALRVEAFNNNRFIDFLAESVAPALDPDTWVATILADIAAFAQVGVHVVALWAEVVDTLSGRVEVQSCAGRVGARISGNQVHVSPGWGKLGALAGVIAIAPFDVVPQPVGAARKVSRFNNAHALQLQTAGFISGFTVVGLGGVYLTRPNSTAAATSDFKFLMRSRVMNKARHLVRQAHLPFMQQHVDPTDLVATSRAMVAAGTAALREMQRAGEIVRGRVLLTPGQDLLSSSVIRFKVRIVPMGYAMEIEDEFAYENPGLL